MKKIKKKKHSRAIYAASLRFVFKINLPKHQTSIASYTTAILPERSEQKVIYNASRLEQLEVKCSRSVVLQQSNQQVNIIIMLFSQ